MTAIIIAKQREHIHILTDAAVYTAKKVIAFANKVLTIPHFPLAITTAGSAGATPWLALELAQHFSGWDDLIDNPSPRLPGIVARCGIEIGTDVMIVGVSKTRGPEAYSFRLNDELPLTSCREEVEASPYWASSPGELVKLPDLIMTPVPSCQVAAAHYEGIDLDAEPADVIWGMRKIVNMQRQIDLPGIGGIGGHALLTTLSIDGVTQGVVETWSEDQIGETLCPAKIDWKKWHAENPKPGSARKAALRVVH